MRTKEGNTYTEHEGDNIEGALPSNKLSLDNIGSSSNLTSNPVIPKNDFAMATILSDLYFYVKKMKQVKQNPQDIISELEKLISFYQNF